MNTTAQWMGLLVAAVCVTAGHRATAQDVSYFRRDRGVASNDKAALPAQFNAEELVWKTKLLPGNSTPCISGDRLYATTFLEAKNELATVAIDRASGKILWKQVVPTKKIEAFHPVGSPASCTPASDGERLYVFFGSYGLLCYDFDGQLLWSKRLGPFQDEFGANSSPILVDDKLILNEDHDIDSFLIAVDKKTGETIWRTPRDGFTRSYSTPVVWESGKGKQILVAGSLQLAAYDAKDGRKLWWVNGLSRILDSTPVVADGRVFVASWTPGGDQAARISMEPFPRALKSFDENGDGLIAKTELPKGAVLTRFFRIDLNQDAKLNEDEWNRHARVFKLAKNVAMAVQPGGTGDVTKTNVKWEFRRGLPTVPSPLVYRGIMYMVKDGGIITSLDAKTGKSIKQGRARGRGNYYASLVAGDGKVFVSSERGVITVLDVTGKQWNIIASKDFGNRIMATPLMRNGNMYIRTDDALYCYSAN